MRLGILADTHDELARARAAVEMLVAAGAEALVHCGDFLGPDILRLCRVLPCYFVFGNNDSDMVPARRQAGVEIGAVCLEWGGTFDISGKRVGVTHGHMTTDVRRVLAARPAYLLSGHSHIAGDYRDGTVRRINPGALHRADQFTVALLDLATDEVGFFTLPR